MNDKPYQPSEKRQLAALQVPGIDPAPTKAEIRQMEASLAADPGNLHTRFKLTAHYYEHRRSKLAAQAHFTHFLWLIDNFATTDFWRYTPPHPLYTAQQRATIKRHIQKQMKLHPKNAEVVGHAARILGDNDRAQELKYYLKAQKLDPSKFEWTHMVALIHRYLALNGPPQHGRRHAKIALAEADKALHLKINRGEIFGIYVDFLTVAIEFGFLDKADEYATSFLRLLSRTPYEFYRQTAWLFQARTALARNQVTKARSLVRKTLRSLAEEEDRESHVASGIRMMNVLDELLRLGQRDIVIEALLVALSKSRSKHKRQIARWLQQVQAGKSPRLHFKQRRR